MTRRELGKFLDQAVDASDLLQGYIDIAHENLSNLTDQDRRKLLKEIAVGRAGCTDPEIMGALAVLECLIQNWEDES